MGSQDLPRRYLERGTEEKRRDVELVLNRDTVNNNSILDNHELLSEGLDIMK